MKVTDTEAEFPPGEVTFEMSNLSPRETELDFAVLVLPHAARIKITQPPWGSKPEAVYTIAPFDSAAGEEWLSKHREDLLRTWVRANKAFLLGYSDGESSTIRACARDWSSCPASGKIARVGAA